MLCRSGIGVETADSASRELDCAQLSARSAKQNDLRPNSEYSQVATGVDRARQRAVRPHGRHGAIDGIAFDEATEVEIMRPQAAD